MIDNMNRCWFFKSSLFIILLIYSCSESNTLSDRSKEEKVINVVNNFMQINLDGKVSVFDSLNSKVVKIPLRHKYTSASWAKIAVVMTTMEIERRALSNILFMDNTTYMVVLDYDFPQNEKQSSEAVFIVDKPVSPTFSNATMYEEIFSYVLNNMSPSDFQFYDFVLDELYKDETLTNDYSFNDLLTLICTDINSNKSADIFSTINTLIFEIKERTDDKGYIQLEEIASLARSNMEVEMQDIED